MNHDLWVSMLHQFYTPASADVYRKEFHICSPVPETGCPIGHAGRVDR